ncbi:MAG: menaquinone via futalosine step 1 [Nitratiruptor sp.]|nr:menaquinone via futalosine step 1 [Nitratiruptor sp.]NPA83834.1 menaquinone via futalosine step 1 [Campylobacterota bacterium]
MVIGKIDYINLLPFYLFLKRSLPNGPKAALEHHKDVPAQINIAFKRGHIEAAMISSIVSPPYRCSDLGIIAHGAVLSVLVCPGASREDLESNTSNVLAQILGQEGEVVIGDKALLRSRKEGCRDLAQLWYERYKLPFVFARFCFRKRHRHYEKLANRFLATPIKIPHYILHHYARKSGLSPKQIRTYLHHIHYRIGHKERIALKRFLTLARRMKRNAPRRFESAGASPPSPQSP